LRTALNEVALARAAEDPAMDEALRELADRVEAAAAAMAVVPVGDDAIAQCKVV
jgi:hypothetical protein